MTTMLPEVYEAFRAAGMPEEQAKKAAEALSAESIATKGDVARIERDLAVLKWMVGVVIAATVVPLLKQLLTS